MEAAVPQLLKSSIQTLSCNSALELSFKFKPQDNDAEQYGIAIGNSLRLFVDRQTKTLTLFRLNLNTTSYRALELDWDKEHELRIFIDNSSIEVFVDGGYDTMTSNFFGPDHTVTLYSTNGSATFQGATYHDLATPLFHS